MLKYVYYEKIKSNEEFQQQIKASVSLHKSHKPHFIADSLILTVSF